MKLYDILNTIIKKEQYSSYLEIGFGTGLNFNNIQINNKTGIDIGHGVEDKSKCFIGTASSFFKINDRNIYDIIFIDGSHLFEDVLQDIYISLDHLSDNGTIVLHDCNPPSRGYQERKQVSGCPGWTGDVWKAIFYLKTNRNDLSLFVVDTDYGCGVIKKKNKDIKYVVATSFIQSLFMKFSMLLFRMRTNYSMLENNQKSMLGLITIDEFLALYK